MKVYDIINAGPRNRFLVRGISKNPLLVSNCTQAVAADLMSYGARKAEDAWMPPFALIHDQGLASRVGNHTGDNFAAALASTPPWAHGLPIKVEAKIAPYYAK